MLPPSTPRSQQHSDSYSSGIFQFQLASDLHLEPTGVDFSELLFRAPGVTVLALCGDLCSPFSPQYPQLLAYAASLFPHVLVITGNNEYFNQRLHPNKRHTKTKIQQQQQQQQQEEEASSCDINTGTTSSTAQESSLPSSCSLSSPSITPSASLPVHSNIEPDPASSSSTPPYTPPPRIPPAQQQPQDKLPPSSLPHPSHPAPPLSNQQEPLPLPHPHLPQSHTMSDVDAKVEALCSAHENVTFLNNSCKVIQGVQFVGSTLWSWIPLEARPRVQQTVQDFSLVLSGPNEPLTPHHSSTLFIRNLDFITQSIAAGRAAGMQNVVLTHHTPSFQGTSAPQYAGSDTTCSYSSSLDHILDGSDVDVWCCGHTHHNFNQKRAGGCRFVSNQRGQRLHVEGFMQDFVVELGAPVTALMLKPCSKSQQE